MKQKNIHAKEKINSSVQTCLYAAGIINMYIILSREKMLLDYEFTQLHFCGKKPCERMEQTTSTAVLNAVT